jgi:GNAT superfamily N-acetyltransferase
MATETELDALAAELRAAIHQLDGTSEAQLRAHAAELGLTLPVPFGSGDAVERRALGPADVLAAGAVQAPTMAAAYGAFSDPAWVATLTFERFHRFWTTILTTERSWFGTVTVGGAVGVTIAVSPWIDTTDLDGATTAVLYAFYAHPSLWGRHLGEPLLEQAQAEAAALGFHDIRLWVVEPHERGHRYWKAHGWQPDGHRLEVGGGLYELRYRR